MKTIMLLFSIQLCVSNTVAQNNIGIIINGNLSNRWSQTYENYEYFFRPGYGLGVFYYHVFDNPKFGLSIDADYSYFRFNQKITGFASYFHTKKSVALFQFPVELNYFFNKLSFSGGLKFVFGHGTGGGISYYEYYDGTITEPIYDNLWQYSKFDFGFTAGMKFALSKRFQLGLNVYQSVIDNGRKYDGKAYWTRFDFGLYYTFLKKDNIQK